MYNSNFNFIKKVPLQIVYKNFERFQDGDTLFDRTVSQICKYLKNGLGKAVIICRKKAEARIFQDHSKDKILTVTGDTSPDDKEIKIEKFISSNSTKTLAGTLLTAEGIDDPSINLVILYDFMSTMEVYIQAVGRLRRNGVCMCLYTASAKLNKSITDSCSTIQMNTFYNLSWLQHYGCCEVYEGLSTASMEVLQCLDILECSSGGDTLDGTTIQAAPMGDGNNGSIQEIIEKGEDDIGPQTSMQLQIIPIGKRPLSSEDRRSTKRMEKVSLILELLQKHYQPYKDIPSMGGVHRQYHHVLYMDGLSEEYLGFHIKTERVNACSGCGGTKNASCACYDEDAWRSIKSLAIELYIYRKYTVSYFCIESHRYLLKRYGAGFYLIDSVTKKDGRFHKIKNALTKLRKLLKQHGKFVKLHNPPSLSTNRASILFEKDVG